MEMREWYSYLISITISAETTAATAAAASTSSSSAISLHFFLSY